MGGRVSSLSDTGSADCAEVAPPSPRNTRFLAKKVRRLAGASRLSTCIFREYVHFSDDRGARP
jgi:hypothetical protein